MKPFCKLAVCVSVLACGCGTTAISVDDLPWTTSTLSSTNCPDLDGRYMDRGFLHLNFFAGLTSTKNDRSGDTFPANVEWKRSPYRADLPLDEMYRLKKEFDKTSVASISSSHERITVTLTDTMGVIYQIITLATNASKMIGCNNGSLVLRHKTVHGKGEGSSSTVEFGETEVRKLPDGSLEVVNRKWYAQTSALFRVGTIESRKGGRNIFPSAFDVGQ